MNLSENFKKFMGMVEQNAQQLQKDLTPTPLPSGSEVWKAGEDNRKKIEEGIIKVKVKHIKTCYISVSNTFKYLNLLYIVS